MARLRDILSKAIEPIKQWKDERDITKAVPAIKSEREREFKASGGFDNDHDYERER